MIKYDTKKKKYKRCTHVSERFIFISYTRDRLRLTAPILTLSFLLSQIIYSQIGLKEERRAGRGRGVGVEEKKEEEEEEKGMTTKRGRASIA